MSKPDGTVSAPFTEQQVERLKNWQNAAHVHPFTCANRNDGKHRTTHDTGVLVPTIRGWVCLDCDYTQDWAYSLMVEQLPAPLWVQP